MLEWYQHEDCLVITPYAPDIQMGTSINVVSTIDLIDISPYAPDVQMETSTDVTNIRDVVNNPGLLTYTGDVYFFEDYLCGYPSNEAGMKEDCNYIKDNFYLNPELVIKSKRLNISYILYRICTIDYPLENRSKEVKVFYVEPKPSPFWFSFY